MAIFGNTTGYTTSSFNIQGWIQGGKFQMGSETNQVANSITAFLYTTSTYTWNARMLIYDISDNLVGATDARSIDGPIDPYAWYIFIFSTEPPLTADAWYYLVGWADGSDVFGLDIGARNSLGNGRYYDQETYNTIPDPWDPSVADADALCSLYCTYSSPTGRPTGKSPMALGLKARLKGGIGRPRPSTGGTSFGG